MCFSMKYLFEDDVNVTCNQLGYLLSLSGLYWIVAFLIFPKILEKTNKPALKYKWIRYISSSKGEEAQFWTKMQRLIFPIPPLQIQLNTLKFVQQIMVKELWKVAWLGTWGGPEEPQSGEFLGFLLYPLTSKSGAGEDWNLEPLIGRPWKPAPDHQRTRRGEAIRDVNKSTNPASQPGLLVTGSCIPAPALQPKQGGGLSL